MAHVDGGGAEGVLREGEGGETEAPREVPHVDGARELRRTQEEQEEQEEGQIRRSQPPSSCTAVF